jgi:hypothetical protein
MPTVRTMAWILDTDGSTHGSTTKTKGRGKAWFPEENVGAVLAVCNLPDASIGGTVGSVGQLIKIAMLRVKNALPF